MDKNEWYEHGIGIKGDSGAGVVDCETSSLCGLVVGETKALLTNGDGYRKALIIDMKDVKNDTVKAAEAVFIFMATEKLPKMNHNCSILFEKNWLETGLKKAV